MYLRQFTKKTFISVPAGAKAYRFAVNIGFGNTKYVFQLFLSYSELSCAKWLFTET